MAYNQELADRVILQFESLHPFIDKKMFGGLGILINGNMCVGVVKENLVVRVGKEQYEKYLKLDGVRPFDFTGKPLTGWVYVSEDQLTDTEALKHWLLTGLDFTLTLPPKG